MGACIMTKDEDFVLMQALEPIALMTPIAVAIRNPKHASLARRRPGFRDTIVSGPGGVVVLFHATPSRFIQQGEVLGALGSAFDGRPSFQPGRR